MLPMTINQQRSTKMMSVINPEVQAIQKKYRNKKDQASMMKQQEEIQQVYDKYGTSMMGGCLPMLVQVPLLLALYPVIYDIQTYVPAIKDAPASVNRFLTIPDLTIAPITMIKNSGDYGIDASSVHSVPQFHGGVDIGAVRGKCVILIALHLKEDRQRHLLGGVGAQGVQIGPGVGPGGYGGLPIYLEGDTGNGRPPSVVLTAHEVQPYIKFVGQKTAPVSSS